MDLWTYQPVGFRLDNPELTRIEPEKGRYWNDATLRYREALLVLCKELGLAPSEYYQFLWCCTVQGWLEIRSLPVFEWELTVPGDGILAFISEPAWDAVIKGESDDWTNVILRNAEARSGRYVSALVPFPLKPEWLTCPGKPVRLPQRSVEAKALRIRPPEVQRAMVALYNTTDPEWAAGSLAIGDCSARLTSAPAFGRHAV
jgi:hypothetical protein